MPDFAPVLTQEQNIAEGTMGFHFRKPDGFQFRAGQAIDLTLVEPPETDAEGNTRAFRSPAHRQILIWSSPRVGAKARSSESSRRLHSA